MPDTRITDLPSEATPATSDVVPIDGATTRKTTIVALVDAARPFANQAEAETGSGTTQSMNPLTTKQAIDIARTVEKEFTAKQTFSTTTSGTVVVQVTTTEDSAAVGPIVDLTRVSASPAASDLLGVIRFMGKDDAAGDNAYGQIRGKIIDPTNFSEDGAIEFLARIAGTNVTALGLANGAIVGAPTGSYQGTGTVNATGYYVNGVAVASIAANAFTAAQSVTPVALTDGATITPNLTLSNHFTLTLGGNRALANPSAKTVGTSFLIIVSQDGTGSRTLSFGTDYEFPGGTPPTLTTTANGVDMISGYVYSSTRILCNIAKAFA